MADYALTGSRWGTKPTGGDGGTVTWAVDASVPASWLDDIRAVFADYSRYANIDFQEVASTSISSIDIKQARIDGPLGTLGLASWESNGQYQLRESIVTIDSGEGYRDAGRGDYATSSPTQALKTVMLHEVGHALGLDHYPIASGSAIMNPSSDTTRVSELTASDIHGIQALYGVRAPAATAPVVVANPSDGPDAVFRFYDTKTGDHFYTTAPAEKANILATLPSYKYEGVAWAVPDKAADTIDVFRFYDDKTSTHFFTTSVEERDNVIKTLPSYHFEGVAFQAYDHEGVPGSVTLDRFYNTETGLHHFSAGSGETDWIKAGHAGTGWAYEGHGFTVAAPTDAMFLI